MLEPKIPGDDDLKSDPKTQGDQSKPMDKPVDGGDMTGDELKK